MKYKKDRKYDLEERLIVFAIKIMEKFKVPNRKKTLFIIQFLY